MEKLPTQGQTNSPENKGEHITSYEEVRLIFEQILNEQEFEEVQKVEDSEGLDLWEVRVNSLEGILEFSYKRKGSFDTDSSKRVDVIHVTFYDADGVPTGGHSIAKFMDGRWKLIP